MLGYYLLGRALYGTWDEERRVFPLLNISVNDAGRFVVTYAEGGAVALPEGCRPITMRELSRKFHISADKPFISMEGSGAAVEIPNETEIKIDKFREYKLVKGGEATIVLVTVNGGQLPDSVIAELVEDNADLGVSVVGACVYLKPAETMVGAALVKVTAVKGSMSATETIKVRVYAGGTSSFVTIPEAVQLRAGEEVQLAFVPASNAAFVDFNVYGLAKYGEPQHGFRTVKKDLSAGKITLLADGSVGDAVLVYAVAVQASRGERVSEPVKVQIIE